MVEGVAALVVATTMLAAMFIGLYVFVFHAGAVGAVAARTARSLGLLPPAPVLPANRAIEPIARDLRRLHLAVRNSRPAGRWPGTAACSARTMTSCWRPAVRSGFRTR